MRTLHWLGRALLLAGVVTAALSKGILPAVARPTTEQLSQIWQQEFPVPPQAVQDVRSASVGSWAEAQLSSHQPHPAVARIVVQEGAATSFGSGTLVDVREEFGLVITNWHVVRDAQGGIQVVFPGGFTSTARALKVDPDWDLAALVIWRPPAEPVPIATAPPRPGDQLTICGYGQGTYRTATGRCTKYYAPRVDLPLHMVELDVQARQGDSGGPIFNQQGQLAGVLFGAGQGTTLGSFGGRVGSFLASLAPDIGKTPGDALAQLQRSQENQPPERVAKVDRNSEEVHTASLQRAEQPSEGADNWQAPAAERAAGLFEQEETSGDGDTGRIANARQSAEPLQAISRTDWFDQVKTALAAVGLLTIVVQVLRAVR